MKFGWEGSLSVMERESIYVLRRKTRWAREKEGREERELMTPRRGHSCGALRRG